MTGVKDDQEKNRWELLPWAAVEDVVRVLTYGAKKYSPENWRKVENGRERYWAAAQRHLAAWRRGERADAETGISHLAHAMCCLAFLHTMDAEK